jgi:hypothetical protein
MPDRQGTGAQEGADRAEALAAVRKALGLERLLDRARAGNGATRLPPNRPRTPARAPKPTHAAA